MRQQIHCLVRAHFLVQDDNLSVEGERDLSGGFYKDSNPTHEVSTPMSKSPFLDPTSKYHHIRN